MAERESGTRKAAVTGSVQIQEEKKSVLKLAADLVEGASDLKKLCVAAGALLPGPVNAYLLGLGQGIVDSLLVTIPLTIAVALIAFAIFDDNSSLLLLAGAVLTLVVGNLLGTSTGVEGLSVAWESSHSLGSFVVPLVAGYGMTYGYVGYIAPLVVGTLAGWLWAKLS